MEELERKEKDRREKKLLKQLEKQQKKLAAKGIHVNLDDLKKDYDHQKAGGKSSLHFDAQKMDEEIDVVGLDRSTDEGDFNTSATTNISDIHKSFDFEAAAVQARKKVTAFSIESLLNSRVQEHQERLQREQDLLQSGASPPLTKDVDGDDASSPPASPRSFNPDRASSPLRLNRDKASVSPGSWHKPEPEPTEESLLNKSTDEEDPREDTETEAELSEAKADPEEPSKPQIHKPSPTFPSLLRGGPNANPFLLAAVRAATQQQQQSQGLSSFLPSSSPPASGLVVGGAPPPPGLNPFQLLGGSPPGQR